MLARRDASPFTPSRLRNEMDALFQNFFGGELLPGDEGLWAGSRSFPALNVWEDADRIYVEAEVPGIPMDDLDLTITGNVLTLSGNRRGLAPENATEHRLERPAGAFRRSVTLPVEVDPGKVNAELKNGVLTVFLPKAEAHRPRKIEVAASGI